MISLVSRVTCIRLVLFSTTFSRTANVPFSFFRLPRMNVLFSSWVLQPESNEKLSRFCIVLCRTNEIYERTAHANFSSNDETRSYDPISSRWNEEKKQINL